MTFSSSNLAITQSGLSAAPVCLTWHEELLRPFESAWSLFFKVCRLNYLSMAELMALIRKKNGPPLSYQLPEAILDSSWLDFTLFAELLGVESDRLRECFLDELGFLPLDAKGYGIRYCPKCWEHGYHCTLFDLALIKECPWHQLTLSDACVTCATMSTIDGSRNITPSERCRHCRRTRCATFLGEGQKEFTATERKAIRAFCQDFVDWKTSIADALPRVTLTENLDAVGRQNIESWHHQLQLGLALEVSGRMPLWKLVPTPISAKLIRWQQGEIQRPDALGEIQKEAGLVITYKAIRRQIVKRYLCGHAKCLSEVMRLRRNESLYIAGDRICPAAFAYVVWRMSVEGIIDIEQLKCKHAIGNTFRLHGGRDAVSIVEQPYRLYTWFFAIWGITTLLGPENRYALRREEPMICSELPTWLLAEDVCNERCAGEAFALVPNPEMMRALSKQQCTRWPRSRSIVWGWSVADPAHYSADERKFVMFKMRAVHAIALSQYYQVLQI